MKYLSFIITILIACSSTFALAQKTKESVEKEIADIKKEIAMANRLLNETAKNKQSTINQIALLNKKIEQRGKLVNTYSRRIKELDKEIENGQNNAKTLNNDLKKLQQEYAKMIEIAYKNRNEYNNLAFLFSADNFNQAFLRHRYLQQFSDARKTKMTQIASTEKKINQQIEKNRLERAEQKRLLEEEKTQKDIMEKEKKELNTMVQSYKNKEKDIQKSIKDKEQQTRKLEKIIENIIAEEVKKAAAKNKNTNDKNTSSTPAETKLASSFVNNKGKLPWPSEKGIVSSPFGKHPHPVSPKVIVQNNGIDIATPENTMARAIFDGEVVSVNKISGANTAVIIRHGNYFTVYSNLDEVLVKRGDQVKTKQEIGRIHTDNTEGKTELHFELWQDKNRLDPEQWLSK